MYALRFFYVNFTPYVGLRQTYYDRGLNDNSVGIDSHLRGVFYTGIDLSTKFYKVFRTTASPLGIMINDLRHIITPSISYNYNPQPTIKRENLFEFKGR